MTSVEQGCRQVWVFWVFDSVFDVFEPLSEQAESANMPSAL